MSSPFENWDSYLPILDEILYRYSPGLTRQLEVKDGITRMVELITFADGSKLSVSAQVPLPPLNDMTPRQVTFLKLTGERGERFDDGSAEAMDLARQSIAMRFLESISKILDKMPEREKVTCPSCLGGRYCVRCYGNGCSDCRGTGVCPECCGHGLIAKE